MAADQDIKAKADELKRGLAQQTGVSVDAVGKILDHLGLHESLSHRVDMQSVAAKNPKLKQAAVSLSNVGVGNIRIATGAVPQ
jgi:hypothetical protein